MLKGFGFEDPQIREFESALIADHEGWRNVYAEAEKGYSDHFNNTDDLSIAERTASWESTRAHVESIFKDAFENAAQRQEGMGHVLEKIFEQQFGAGKGAGAVDFYQQMGDIQRKMGTTMREIRAQVNEQANGSIERNALYRELRDSQYVPMIHEYLQKLSNGIPDAIAKAVAPDVHEYLPEAIGAAPAVEQRPAFVPSLSGWKEVPAGAEVTPGVETRVFPDGNTYGRLQDANLLPDEVRTVMETQAVKTIPPGTKLGNDYVFHNTKGSSYQPLNKRD